MHGELMLNVSIFQWLYLKAPGLYNPFEHQMANNLISIALGILCDLSEYTKIKVIIK